MSFTLKARTEEYLIHYQTSEENVQSKTRLKHKYMN